jgi:hypothetical protein
MGTRNYLEMLRERGKRSRVYEKHQLLGLELADLLRDRAHKALYMKLAKERDPDTLRELARSVAERKGVRNRGALFMYLLAHPRPATHRKKTRRSPKRKA